MIINRANQEVINKEIQKVKTSPITREYGCTFSLNGSIYRRGGLVVPIYSFNLRYVNELSLDMIRVVISKTVKTFGNNRKIKVGIYKFPRSTKMSIDINLVLPNSQQELAVEFCKRAGQESIFNLSTFENIKTGADGNNPVEFTGKQLVEIVKSLSKFEMPKAVSETTTNKTKKEIAVILDRSNPLFNFSCETGLTSYHNYNKAQLVAIANQHKIELPAELKAVEEYVGQEENKKVFNLTTSIIAYESGELNDADVVELFSELIKSGLAWSLQGCYGRTAMALIHAKVISKKGEIL